MGGGDGGNKISILLLIIININYYYYRLAGATDGERRNRNSRAITAQSRGDNEPSDCGLRLAYSRAFVRQ